MRSKNILVCALLLVLTAGCVGPYNAFNSVSSWNSRATDQKWLNELIHVGMWIIPVYPFAILGDYLIFNSIEFWGGENPIQPPQPFTAQKDL